MKRKVSGDNGRLGGSDFRRDILGQGHFQTGIYYDTLID
jgi:hypothetical protein